jgi:hypothetical protein
MNSESGSEGLRNRIPTDCWSLIGGETEWNGISQVDGMIRSMLLDMDPGDVRSIVPQAGCEQKVHFNPAQVSEPHLLSTATPRLDVCSLTCDRLAQTATLLV